MKLNRFAALWAVAALALGASTAHADTAQSDFALSGTFTATCSFTSPTFTLGSVDLSTYVYNPGTAFEHARVPASVQVTCNTSSLTWTMCNTGDTDGVNMTIGATTDNKVCVVNDTSTTSLPNCAKSNSSAPTKITGTGTMTRSVFLAIYNNSGTRSAFKGSGSMSATVPLTLAF
jgi:hypothetical protein